MIAYQITHKAGFDLREELSRRIRLPDSGARLEKARKKGIHRITAFVLVNRRTELVHKSYSGKINFDKSSSSRVSSGKILIPHAAKDKRIIGSFVDLLYRHFPDEIAEVRVQF